MLTLQRIFLNLTFVEVVDSEVVDFGERDGLEERHVVADDEIMLRKKCRC